MWRQYFHGRRCCRSSKAVTAHAAGGPHDWNTEQTTPSTGTSPVKHAAWRTCLSLPASSWDVVTPEQARIAQDAGAVAVKRALERPLPTSEPQGGVACMSDPDLITGIIEAVSIPVMAKTKWLLRGGPGPPEPRRGLASMSPRSSPRPTTPTTRQTALHCSSCAGPPIR